MLAMRKSMTYDLGRDMARHTEITMAMRHDAPTSVQ
jgi:IS30 family transposase